MILRAQHMLLKQIILYSAILLIIVTVFLLFKRACKHTKILRRKNFTEKRKKTEDELYKEKKQKELQQESPNNQKDKDEAQELYIEREYEEDIDIVGIAKPVGKWTKMVMQNGGFVSRLAQLIRSEGGKKGFWELFVKAQASAQGKYKGKGR
ncbi:MAG: hypothetical protein QWI36_00250 [Wolbachia endosymbiont of Tyrophagus putrescentiae]|nr:hypothetical protein [Wolbachia endosymbiont of Tyrophagus putrescentiae]